LSVILRYWDEYVNESARMRAVDAHDGLDYAPQLSGDKHSGGAGIKYKRQTSWKGKE
jgi:hypothetical protein